MALVSRIGSMSISWLIVAVQHHSRLNSRRQTGRLYKMDRDPEKEAYQPPEVAKQEEANILRAKILVALITVLAASGVGASTYLLVKDQAKTNFENQFTGYSSEGCSSEITTVPRRQKADQLFSAFDSFAASIGSEAAVEIGLRNTSWPFYVVSDWSIKAERLTELTGVSDPLLSLTSIVQAEHRVDFNELAQQAIVV
eukprot:scaffold580_cov72-Cylindrotheca_fusiformis.AAC.7